MERDGASYRSLLFLCHHHPSPFSTSSHSLFLSLSLVERVIEITCAKRGYGNACAQLSFVKAEVSPRIHRVCDVTHLRARPIHYGNYTPNSIHIRYACHHALRHSRLVDDEAPLSVEIIISRRHLVCAWSSRSFRSNPPTRGLFSAGTLKQRNISSQVEGPGGRRSARRCEKDEESARKGTKKTRVEGDAPRAEE